MGNSGKANEKLNMTVKKHADWQVLAVVLVLVIFGLIMLYSVSSYNAQVKFGSSTYFLVRQLMATGIGIAGLVAATLIPYDVWRTKLTNFIYAASIVSIFLVLTSIGIESNGAKRWIDIKIFTLQPAEIVKVAVILMLAKLIAQYKDRLKNIKAFGFVLAFDALAAGLVGVITDDLGTAVIIFGIGLIMLYIVAPEKKFVWWTVAAVIVLGIIFVVSAPFRMNRIKAWLNVEAYAQDESYQIMQALYAIGNGGLLGKGLGKSTQKMGFVPESQNDMIFSIIVEELGILGGIALLLLFALLIWRLWKLYKGTDDLFGRLIVAGIIAHIGLQTFINTAVVTSLIPNTGVPLPFISYGGSSIIMILVEIGLAMSVARGRSFKKQDARSHITEDVEKGVIYYH